MPTICKKTWEMYLYCVERGQLAAARKYMRIFNYHFDKYIRS